MFRMRVFFSVFRQAIFTAAAYDKTGAPISGLDVKWKGLDEDKNAPVTISPRAVFASNVPGKFKITADVAGRKAHVKVTVTGTERLPNIRCRTSAVLPKRPFRPAISPSPKRRKPRCTRPPVVVRLKSRSAAPERPRLLKTCASPPLVLRRQRRCSCRAKTITAGTAAITPPLTIPALNAALCPDTPWMAAQAPETFSSRRRCSVWTGAALI